MFEKYIQFAIDNGFKFKNVNIERFAIFSRSISFYDKCWFSYTEDHITLITSKDFIDAISKNQTLLPKEIASMQWVALYLWELEEFISLILKSWKPHKN